MRRRRVLSIVVFAVVCLGQVGYAGQFEVGHTVALVDRRRADGSDLGIPGHDSVGQTKVTFRIPSRAIGVIEKVEDPPKDHWIKIAVQGRSHWITGRYVESVLAPSAAQQSCTIACWNLEHFSNSSTRGFPENLTSYTPKGPTIPPRTEAQVGVIADTIKDSIKASFLALSEINGKNEPDDDGDEVAKSAELALLVTKLGERWQYAIAYSGGKQRVAILYDEAKVRVNEIIEFSIPPRRIQGKDIFDRDPLVAHVTLLQNGAPRNDLVVVALHLASGQGNNKNHDAAMTKLLAELKASQEAGELGGTAEHDILLMGDLNANMFSPPAERFFIDMDAPDGPWDVLAGDDYSATRLSRSPRTALLGLYRSRIDYIIASRKTQSRNGLAGDEVRAATARVHTELLQWKEPKDFRRDLSDHLPVSIEVQITADAD